MAKELSKSEQQVHDDIANYGCHIVHVVDMADEPSEQPNFSYSIGLFKNFNLPEIVIIGLKQELRHDLINNICYDYEEGVSLKISTFNADILEDFDCLVVEVDKKYFKDYFGWARWFYGNDDFPVSQIIYPTLEGLFPWNKDFPIEIKQPILNDEYQLGI